MTFPVTDMISELHKAESHTILPVERLGDTLVVVPHGDLGGYSPHTFHGELHRVQGLLNDETLKNVVVDLSGSRYFGSEMIGALVALRESVISRGRCALAEVSQETRIGLDVIKVDTLFEIFDTKSQAISEIATMTVGDRVHRHRRPLKWVVGLCLAGLIGWGIYASRVGYVLFGSRIAIKYERIASAWNEYEAGLTKWTPEETRLYREELIEDVQSWQASLEHAWLIPSKEQYWLQQALQEFRDHLTNEDHRFQFLRAMRNARFHIMERTGLHLPLLGPEDLPGDSDQPPDQSTESNATSPPHGEEASESEAAPDKVEAEDASNDKAA